MALTTLRGGFRRDRAMSESEWTKLLLERGEAELARSEKRGLARSLENSGAEAEDSAASESALESSLSQTPADAFCGTVAAWSVCGQ
jgi:hypothetical protein